MDYKKEYEEMVQRARELHEGGNALTKLQMEIVCPELEGSEDERIRKHLIAIVELYWGKTNDPDKAKDLAYLEKQKEQKPAEWSEEDERIRGHIIDVLIYYAENHSALTVAFINRDIDWLKSLSMRCPKKTE